MMAMDVEHLKSIPQPFVFHLWRAFCLVPHPILNCVVCFLDVWNNLDINHQSDMSLVRTFFHSVGCLFPCTMLSFPV